MICDKPLVKHNTTKCLFRHIANFKPEHFQAKQPQMQ